jgi:hypothetical protein
MRLPILVIFFLLCRIICFGQIDTLNVEEDSLNTLKDSDKPKSTFTIGAVYANNASYYGQKAVDKTPYIAAATTYRFKFGLYFTGLAYKLLNDTTSSISAGNLGAGVNFNLSKKLAADISYNHNFYPSLSPFLQAGNADNANLSLTYQCWLAIKLSGDYAFGKTTDGFATGGISKMISLFSITKKDVVTIEPSADVVAGTQRFYNTYVTQQKLRDSLLGIIPILGWNPSGGTTTTVSATSFDIISYNFKLPLAYNRSNYLLEVAYQLSLLSNKAQTGAGKVNSFGTLSFYYQF